MKRIIRIAAVSLIVLCAALLIFRQIHADETATFWGMLSNNLATSGVTRTVSQSSGGVNVTQLTQLSLGSSNTAHSLTTFKGATGTIVTEEVSDNKSDVVRYRAIDTTQKNAAGKPVDTSKIVGKWASLGANESFGGVSSQLFEQSLQGILPVASLSPENRTALIKYMRDNDVFSFDVAKVKTVTQSGHHAYQYAVTIHPAAYVSMMQRFGKLVGANQYASVDPNSYVGAADISATLTVDVASRQLLSIDQASSGHTETYSGYGIVSSVAIPRATLTAAALERQVSSL